MATITFRPDDENERALATLTADGRSASAVIRDALTHEAQRQDDERLRAEVMALAADPDDVAEARRVIEDLEPLRAWGRVPAAGSAGREAREWHSVL